MIQNFKVRYKLKLTQGEFKGKVIDLIFDIEDLEEEDISQRLIDENYYEGISWPTDYYDILERQVITEEIVLTDEERIKNICTSELSDTWKSVTLAHCFKLSMAQINDLLK